MAGNKFSGRRSQRREDGAGIDGHPDLSKVDWLDDAPPVAPSTPDEVRDASQWVWRQQCKGLIDARQADSMNTTLKTALNAIRTQHGLHELGELRALVDRMEKATGSVQARAARERHTAVAPSSSTPTLGRIVAPPDGESH